MKFDLYTATLCFMGWLLHWLMSWQAARKVEKKGLIDFIDDDPPAFWISVISTAAIYMLGPKLLSLIGIVLPPAFDDLTVKCVFAFVAGYMADSIVNKLNDFRGIK